MISIERFHALHLPQVQLLLNVHLGALVPGWSLPQGYIAGKLERDPDEYVVDPWVIERATLCAVERQRVVAAIHLLRYGSGPEVGGDYRNAGEINWFVAWPEASEAATTLLEAAQQRLRAWGVSKVWAEMGSLAGPFSGVPDVWPHLAVALSRAGFLPSPGSEEAVYGGPIEEMGAIGAPPLAGLSVARSVGRLGASFTALLEGQMVGRCDCSSDLTAGGALPALAGWAELTDLEVDAAWRNRGIGSWLVRHAIAWLRLGRCDRIVLSVAAEDEAAGAGRFYERFGWRPLVRQQKGWQWHPTQA